MLDLGEKLQNCVKLSMYVTQERRVKQVVMGNIGPNESFAELSLLKEEPMTYSIITSSDVTLGTISPDNLYSLDETTLELLLQSCQPTFDNLTQVRNKIGALQA